MTPSRSKRLRVIDYFGLKGGPGRYMAELLPALVEARPQASVELVSHGPAMDDCGALLGGLGLPIDLRDIPPRLYFRNTPPKRVAGIPGTGRLQRLRGAGSSPIWHLSADVFLDCDLVWLPFCHYYRVPRACSAKTLATFHDLTPLGFWPEGDPLRLAFEVTTRELLDSESTIIVTSATTVAELRRVLAVDPRRVRLVPVAEEHRSFLHPPAAESHWAWESEPFVLIPANLARHKNQTVVIEAMSRWIDRKRLVLTGFNAELTEAAGSYNAGLVQLAEDKGLAVGHDVIGLGYVDDGSYQSLLRSAWAVVMPTLSEGGGSFPVAEAVHVGVPTLVSDVPVLREQVARMGAEVMWFDPTDPSDLAGRLCELETSYTSRKQMAVNQAQRIQRRSWAEVAAEYWDLIDEAFGRG